MLFGDSPMSYGTFSGLKLGAGVTLGWGFTLEGSYFTLERRSLQYSAASGPRGNPLLGISIFNTAIGIEDALLTSNPDVNVGPWSGNVAVASHTHLDGWELNLGAPSLSGRGWTLQFLAGFRSLDLNEDFVLQDTFQPQVANVLTFLGQPVPAQTVLTDYDRFATTNHFYGGQVGARLSWQSGAFGVDLIGKVAPGVDQQSATIAGSSSATPPGGATVTVPGGIYALPTNIGHYSRSTFSLASEAGINFCWNITPNIKATVGYTFLYWTNVLRPGAQLNRDVDETLVPTHQFFGLTPVTGQPAFSYRETDFWAQGVTCGLAFRY